MLCDIVTSKGTNTVMCGVAKQIANEYCILGVIVNDRFFARQKPVFFL